MVAEMRTEQVLSQNTFFLNPRLKCERAQQFNEKLEARIIGQEKAVCGMSNLYQLFLTGGLQPCVLETPRWNSDR
jgi:hypothetical protein